MALIEIRGVTTIFGPAPATALRQRRSGMDKTALLAGGHTLGLDEVDLDIEAGEIFVVMGLSGSGKSTLLRHINRLIEPTAGRVRVDGQDVMALGTRELVALRRRRIAMVFQGFGLLDHRRVIDNVALGLELRGVRPQERRTRAMQWIDRVGLSGYEQHLPVQLSGGMRQRVGLARALASETDIILMDEPFSALDPPIRAQLQRELLALQAAQGRTVVFVTHDLDEALRLGTRLAILRDGKVVQVGTPWEVLTRPADAQSAEFSRQVNRARALPIGTALAPWPADLPMPDPADATETVDADASIEDVLHRLVGRVDPLAVRRGDAIVGQVSMSSVRALLAPAASVCTRSASGGGANPSA
jgi:glycine betaine/proline transport system ATP-binding protein